MNRQNQHGISRQRNYRKDNDPVGQHDRHPPYGKVERRNVGA